MIYVYTGFYCKNLVIYISGFICCGIVIFLAGRKLSYYGDLIADLTGMGKSWMGLILLAAITSLPELMAGFSASAIIQSADLAVGDILGSCVFNLGLLALLDAFVPRHKTLFGLASQHHIIAAAMGIILIALAGMGLSLPKEIAIIPGIGITSLTFITVYFFSVWIIYRFDARQEKQQAAQQTQTSLSLPAAVKRFVAFAIVIIGAALLLPYFIDHIARDFGLSKTFAGTLLLAVSTSLPEIAVSIAAVRMGAIDMSVGNLLGSNLFNILILALDDVFYTKGLLLKDASDMNIVSCLATIMMAGVAIIGLVYKVQAKRHWLAWDALIIFGIYIFNMLLLYRLTSL